MPKQSGLIHIPSILFILALVVFAIILITSLDQTVVQKIEQFNNGGVLGETASQ